MYTDEIQQSIKIRKNELINRLLFILNMLVIVAVLGSVSRFIEIGWQNIMILHIIIAIIILILTLCRNRIAYLYKSWIIVLMFFFAALGGLLTFGMAGGNLAIWVTLPIYAAALINTRVSKRFIYLMIAVFICVSFFSVKGLLHTGIDYNAYLHSWGVWISTILSLPLFTYMLVVIIENLDGINRDLIEDINRQKEELRKVNLLKDKIFSVISHDLRTPFQGLIGYLEVITSDKAYHQESDPLFPMLLESSKNTHLMLENLLIWAQSELSDARMEMKPVGVLALVQEVCAVYHNIAAIKGIKINIRLDESEVILCDEPSMKILFSNLLSNAIKFSHENSEIEIDASTENNSRIITIKDSGVGMSREVVDNLLNADNLYTTFGTANEKGSGLGVNICKQIIDKNNGKLEIDSVPGQGTTIRLIFGC